MSKELGGAGEHLTPEDLEAYWSRRLRPERLVWVARHLSACATCRTAAAASPQTVAAYHRLETQLSAAEHLDFESLTGFLDGTLSREEANLAGQHLIECGRCAEDLEAIRLVSSSGPMTQPGRKARLEATRPVRDRRRMGLLVPALAAAVVVGILLGRSPIWRDRPSPANPELAETRRLLDELARKLDRLQKQPQGPPGPAVPPKVVQTVPGSEPNSPTGPSSPTADPTVPASVEVALNSGVLRFPETISPLLLPEETVRGAKPGTTWVQDLHPTRTVVVDDRPRYSWQTLPGQWTYDVTVAPVSGGEQLRSGPLRTPAWRSPARLKRGITYTWQVSGISSDGKVLATPAPKPRFRVLDEAGHRAVAAARARYASRPDILGVILAEHGVLDEAEKELQKHVRSQPGSRSAAKLLDRVRAMLRPNSVSDEGAGAGAAGISIPSVGMDLGGRTYPRMLDAYNLVKARYRLTLPDDWAAQHGPDDGGRLQSFKNGQGKLFTRSGPDSAPAYYMEGPILEKYDDLKNRVGKGGPYGPLGWPTSVEEEITAPRNGTSARFQQFEHGAIYHWLSGRLRGYTFEIHDDLEAGLRIYQKYAAFGGHAGNRHLDPDLRYDFGLPDDNIVQAGTNPQTGQAGILGRFEGAQIYGVRGRGVFVVTGRISDKFERLGGTDDPAGFPLSDRTKAGRSGAGSKAEGVAQEFEGGTFYWRRFGSDWDDQAYLVEGALLKAYRALGGPGGKLGYPISDPTPLTSPTGTRGVRQAFEGGELFSSRFGAFAVYKRAGDPYETRLGFPVEAPHLDGRQKFEGGTLAPVAP